MSLPIPPNEAYLYAFESEDAKHLLTAPDEFKPTLALLSDSLKRLRCLCQTRDDQSEKDTEINQKNANGSPPGSNSDDATRPSSGVDVANLHPIRHERSSLSYL
ncbi:hypothetical protein PHSY_001776 [Pseudozyma hubeiensis SY62]|uniref:Uncharacterized protein n=1 Tax=Pseudozyma hubeiensis (strain SY62) TaxID=1305764 RepID=R9P7X8_PSEHS|nr:hypothetical protein PHSY_001776 [Pseudozyma hubeiensis SY62]GAC94205.1 hypothetical protein PHSY_001776 [Pseudozyma hubeiensis SY62]